MQAAVTRRADTDYIFDFWTALGWTILCRHDRAEQAAEQELAAIYDALGVTVALPLTSGPKQQHSYAGRIVALVASCGIYVLWWTYNLMIEGNQHQQRSWASDDALWTASAVLASA